MPTSSSKADDYRRTAERYRGLARATGSRELIGHYLDLADTYDELARAEDVLQRDKMLWVA